MSRLTDQTIDGFAFALTTSTSDQSALASPPSLVIYGPRASGKSGVVRAYVETAGLPHAVVRCRECVTGRHLLERTVASVTSALRRADGHTGPCEEVGTRCENMSALGVQLQRMLPAPRKFVLIFDGVDAQREAPATLLPALARLGESLIPHLTIVLIVRHPSPRLLRHAGVPHIHFPAYTRAQSIHILSRTPSPIFLEPPSPGVEYDDEERAADEAWLWPRFCAAVWDSLGADAARDLVAYREVCGKLWRPFVAPIVRGEMGTRDFSRLLVQQRRLFQEGGALLDSIIPESPTRVEGETGGAQELPYHAKWLVIAAYLASYNPSKTDALHFMKSTERQRRKKGGRGRKAQSRKVPRHLLGTSAFALDRLLAILHAILPHDLRPTIDVYTQLATLCALRLLVRTGVGGWGSVDPLEPGGKWRVGGVVTWEYAHSLARSLSFNFLDYVAE